MDRLKKDDWILSGASDPRAGEIYRQACAQMFDITLHVDPARFHNRLEGYQFGNLVFGRCRGVPQRFERRRSHILADSTDTVHIILVLSDTIWSCDSDGVFADQTMGTIRLIDMARPYDLRTEPYETLNLMVPRAALGEAGKLDFHGRVASEEEPTGALLGQHLRALWGQVDRLTHTGAVAAAAATVALATGVVAMYGRDASGDARPLDKRLRADARAIIDARLGDPYLSPDAIRAELGVSRSLLYQSFEGVGGVAGFIQARRLDHAFDTLTSPAGARLTLAEVAYACGFRSDAHFSRAFRDRFGMPPGRLRSLGGHARAIGISAVDNPDDVWGWLKRL